MRKVALPITMLTLAALAISACSASTSGIPVTGSTPAATDTVSAGTPAATSAVTGTTAVNSTGTPSAANTQSASATGTPSASATSGSTTSSTGTPSANGTSSGSAGASSTAVATGTSTAGGSTSGNATGTPVAVATGTASASVTSTASAGSATTTPSASVTGTPVAQATGTAVQSTPGASLPVQSVSYVKLSDLFKMTVSAKDNTQVGTVNGVLIDQLVKGDVMNNATPSSGSNGTSNQPLRVNPVIRYVLVNTQASASASNSSSAKQVFIPWQAFDFSNATPNAQTGVLNLSALNLSVSSQVVSGAPVYTQANSTGFTTPGWDTNISQYWTSQGLSIPATGSANTQNNAQLLLTQNMGNVQVVGPNSQLIGQVADFLVNTTTGQLQFAEFNGGQTFNNRSFIVPLSYLNWVIDTASTQAGNLGKITLNFSPQVFNTAPFFDSLKGITLGQDWPSQIQNFWNTIQPTVTP